MKTRIKILLILIAVFAVSLIAGICAGCSIGERTAQDMADELGLKCPVTYYANGGQFQVGTSLDQKVYRTVYYKSGAPILNIGVVNSLGQNLTISRDGYNFDGWEYCKLDADGKPVLKDSEGQVLNVLENGTADMKGSDGRQLLEQSKRFTAEPSGEKAFKNGNLVVEEGKPLYLAATWSLDSVIEFRLVTDTPITAKETGEDGVEKDVTYKNNDVIATREFTYSTISVDASRSPKTFSTHSYIQMYYDEACKDPLMPNARFTKPADGANITVYAKYLEGEWTTVRNASDVSLMLGEGSGNYYVPYDFSCGGSDTMFYMRTSGNFNGRVVGNGFTISDIAIGATLAQTLSNGATASLFGRLGAEAEISGLTLKNVSARMTIRGGAASIYALFSAVETGAKLTDFKVDGFDLQINAGSAMINNIQNIDGNYQTTSWLYGTETDAEFESAYGGVVKNATLKIDNKQVIGGQQ